MTSVVVVGAGPTALLTAGDLADAPSIPEVSA